MKTDLLRQVGPNPVVLFIVDDAAGEWIITGSRLRRTEQFSREVRAVRGYVVAA